ncbi:MAG: hypothetical protein IPJ04_00105 [Candidatus Eisenbacteria bacterium]|nr:hypothetical protein [Candidatus Eisenbacteria bacterium]
MDSDYRTYVPGGVEGRYWVTGDAIHYGANDYIYGAQGFPPAGGSTAVSMMFDYDGNVANVDKFEIGDIEITCPNDTGSVHGGKYRDEDCDGKHDPGEVGLASWPIVVTGPVGLVHALHRRHRRLPRVGPAQRHLHGVRAGGDGLEPDAARGRLLHGRRQRLGHARLPVRQLPLVRAAAGAVRKLPDAGVLWLPLDEATGGPVAHDVAGSNPAQISGDLASILNPVAMDKGLRFSLAGDHLRVTDSPSLDFGDAGDFSLVASVPAGPGRRTALPVRQARGGPGRPEGLGAVDRERLRGRAHAGGHVAADLRLVAGRLGGGALTRWRSRSRAGTGRRRAARSTWTARCSARSIPRLRARRST